MKKLHEEIEKITKQKVAAAKSIEKNFLFFEVLFILFISPLLV